MLNVRDRSEAEREIAHTNQLTVLHHEGRIVHQRMLLDEVWTEARAALRALADG